MAITSHITARVANLLRKKKRVSTTTLQEDAKVEGLVGRVNANTIGSVELVELNKMGVAGQPYCQLIFRVNGKELKYWLPDIALFEMTQELEKRCLKPHGLSHMMEHTKLTFAKWYGAIWLITAHKKGISSFQLARDLGIGQKAAWFLNHRIRAMVMAS